MSVYNAENVKDMDKTTPTEGATPPSEVNNSLREIKAVIDNQWAIETTSGNVTLGATDSIVRVNGAHTITLPQASTVASATEMKSYVIILVADATATIKTYSAETLDGTDRSSTGITMTAQYGTFVCWSNGTNWHSSMLPKIASFANAPHDHSNEAGGGPLGTEQVLQVVYGTEAGVKTINALFPRDNTIPQYGEGVEIDTLAITPKSASSNFIIEATASGVVAGGASANTIQLAIFETAVDNNALGINAGYGAFTDSNMISMRVIVASSATDTRTFQLVGGTDASTAWYVNANNSGTREYGGVQFASITITEVAG